MSLRKSYVDTGRRLVRLAFEIGSGIDLEEDTHIANPDRYNATVLNGLLALALVKLGDPVPLVLEDILGQLDER
jgi:hypothetical protein